MSRGRPFEPGNKYGRGRPPGSRNKRTLMAQKLLEAHSGALMGLAIVKAGEDPQILRLLLNLAVPKRRDLPVKLATNSLHTIADLDRASHTVMKKACAGKISWNEAAEISDVIENRRRLLETRDLEQRISKLENGGAPPLKSNSSEMETQ